VVVAKVRDNLGMMPMKLKTNPHFSSTLPTFCSVLAITLLATACSTKAPAPVVNRTGPGSQPTAPVVRTAPPVVAQAPAPTPAPVASDTQTAPVRTGTIDNKPLETKPLDKPPVIAAPTGAPAASAASMIRTQPKGLKRPYSDTLLAELKAADAPPVPVVVPAVVATAPTPIAAPAPATAAIDPKASQLGWPVAGKVTQGFGKDKSTGMSFSGKIGDPIASAADGKVIFSNTTLPQYGKMIIVKHDDDTHTVYAHNKTLLVKEGQQVKKGQKIAELGDSGATEPKLYFEVRSKGKPVDPQKLLPPR
jgi:lipoprotein NlpD